MSLKSPRLFFDSIRGTPAKPGILGPTLDAEEVSGCEAILTAFEGFPLADAAYALGTAYLETAHTMQPVKEIGGPKYFFRMYDPKGNRPTVARALGNLFDGDGVKFAGRGFPQVTGRKNYALAEKVFGIPFTANPDLMMEPVNAGKVMAHFMKNGLFTGKKLADYLPRSGPATFEQFKPARRIINGMDRADDVAGYAMQFQPALVAGGWA
jgi:hypothetical protein